MESGESPYDTAIRELKEEIGQGAYHIQSLGHLCTTDSLDIKHSIHIHLFTCRKIADILPVEHDEYKWLNSSEISRFNLVQVDKKILEEYYQSALAITSKTF